MDPCHYHKQLPGFYQKQNKPYQVQVNWSRRPIYMCRLLLFPICQAAAILELVRELPPATQAVFNLYVMEGYNHAEIGKLAGISEGTSKWHLSEARKKLQKKINEQSS
jgi:DNA-binding NarL/FixJ family response regulator